MQDVVKTNVKRKQSSKRTRRRRRKMSLYFLLVIFLVFGIGIALSMTLFFNVNKVVILGDSEYSDEDIVAASGVLAGDNLVRLDSYAVEQSVLGSLINIEEVSIHKKFPSTVEITTKKCVPTANIAYDGGYLIVSAKGKLLNSVDFPQEGLLTVLGYAPQSSTLGTKLSSAEDQKNRIYTAFMGVIAEWEDHSILSVDMTDPYNILVNFENRIDFYMGNSNEIPYKLTLAETAIAKLNDQKQYQLRMVGSNKISVTQSRKHATRSYTPRSLQPEPTRLRG